MLPSISHCELFIQGHHRRLPHGPMGSGMQSNMAERLGAEITTVLAGGFASVHTGCIGVAHMWSIMFATEGGDFHATRLLKAILLGNLRSAMVCTSFGQT